MRRGIWKKKVVNESISCSIASVQALASTVALLVLQLFLGGGWKVTVCWAGSLHWPGKGGNDSCDIWECMSPQGNICHYCDCCVQIQLAVILKICSDATTGSVVKVTIEKRSCVIRWKSFLGLFFLLCLFLSHFGLPHMEYRSQDIDISMLWWQKADVAAVSMVDHQVPLAFNPVGPTSGP